MTPELDSTLCKKYPKMFANRYGDMKSTAMCWGFEHGDGWYNIIDSLCGNIQHHIDWREKQHNIAQMYNEMVTAGRAGNMALLDEYYSGHHKADQRIQEALNGNLRDVPPLVPQVVVDQVKEKFGCLRFYYTGGDEQIHGMVRMAESMSACTCEQCGVPGKQHTGGWIVTLCDAHAEERGIYTSPEEENEF